MEKPNQFSFHRESAPICELSPNCNRRRLERVSLFLLLVSLALLSSCSFAASRGSQENPFSKIPSLTPQIYLGNGAPSATPYQPLPYASDTPLPPPPQGTHPSPLPTATSSPTPSRTPPPEHSGDWLPPNSFRPGTPPVTEVPPPMPLLTGPETVNFLLIGSDRRDISFRTDTLVIASARPDDQAVTLISIPRDLYVYIPGWSMNRINTAYQQGYLTDYPDGGGPGLLKDTILYNLGIRIDHTALVEFDGFRQIVDTLGGVDIPLACPFTDWHIIDPKKSDQDPKNWHLITIGPGIVHMDGDLALWYARSRLNSSDFDRGRRQQEVLRALYARGLQLNALLHIPQLYSEFRSSVDTDLSLDDLLSLAPLAKGLSAPRIQSAYINRSVVTAWRTPSGAAVQLPVRPALEQLLRAALAPPGPQEVEKLGALVEVQNGTLHPDWGALAAERLHYAGFETQISAADSNAVAKTRLYDLTPAQDQEQSSILIGALGLQDSALIASPDLASPVAYRLVLGADYDPCFDPSKLER